MLGGQGRLEAARAVDCAPQRFSVIGGELHRIGQNSPLIEIERTGPSRATRWMRIIREQSPIWRTRCPLTPDNRIPDGLFRQYHGLRAGCRERRLLGPGPPLNLSKAT